MTDFSLANFIPLTYGDFACILVFLAVAAFGVGRILGFDRYIESYKVDGQSLTEKYRLLGHILG